MLRNDVPDELRCPLMWICGGFVCAWCASEVDDLFTAAVFRWAQEKRRVLLLKAKQGFGSLGLQPARPLRRSDEEKHKKNTFIQILVAD